MGMYREEVRETAAIRANIEGAAEAIGGLVAGAEAYGAALEKAAFLPSPPFGVVGDGVGTPAPVRSGGGSGASAVAGASGASGLTRPAFLLDQYGNPLPIGSDDLDIYGNPLFGRTGGRRVSSSSAGSSGSGSAPRRLGIGADQLGNRPGYRPGYAAGGSGSSTPTPTYAGGKATVYDPTNASLLSEVVGLLRQQVAQGRSDGGAGLRRRGEI